MALIPVEEALDAVLAGAAPLDIEEVALEDGFHRVLAQDLAALRDVPSADVSAMDGYAVRGADVERAPVRLRVIGEAAAGHAPRTKIAAGEAMRIFTGAVVPDGADTIVIQENTARDGEFVTVTEPAQAGASVRRRGGDFASGRVLLTRGTHLNDRDLSLAATMNHAVLPVYRRPRVALLATGDELVPPGEAAAPGEVIHSNVYALAALIRQSGGAPRDHGIVPDTLEATCAAIGGATGGPAAADILVTTGGASVGDHDYVGRALEAEGFDMAFWKVAMRPGKPVMFGRRGALRVIGLPGNPVSSYVGALLFLAPLIRALSGRSDIRPAHEPALLGAPLAANGARQDYMRATLSTDDSGRTLATALDRQDSSMLTPLARADALIVRPPGAPAAPSGSPCVILKLPF